MRRKMICPWLALESPAPKPVTLARCPKSDQSRWRQKCTLQVGATGGSDSEAARIASFFNPCLWPIMPRGALVALYRNGIYDSTVQYTFNILSCSQWKCGADVVSSYIAVQRKSGCLSTLR